MSLLGKFGSFEARMNQDLDKQFWVDFTIADNVTIRAHYDVLARYSGGEYDDEPLVTEDIAVLTFHDRDKHYLEANTIVSSDGRHFKLDQRLRSMSGFEGHSDTDGSMVKWVVRELND